MSIFTLNNTTSSTDIVHHIVGDIVVQSSGVFNGAVVSFEYSNEEGMPFHILDDFSMTTSDEKLMAIANSSNFRLIVTGATATTDIKISILRRSS
jgi:hypothetical protein